MVTRKLRLNSDEESLLLLGDQDRNLRRLEREHRVEIFIRHDPEGEKLHLSVRGTTPRVAKAVRELQEKLKRIRAGSDAVEEESPVALFPAGPAATPGDAVFMTSYGKAIRPRSPRQQHYLDAIAAGEMTFGIGPAGTGKTFLAVAAALRSLQRQEVSRIVLTRPVVEAGEKLGFLPGDFYEKVNPYLRPLYDVFLTCLGPDKFRMWQADEIIEVVPLAYMRGRTIENAFIILDEAQNTTIEQMKMFLTRMGTGSRVVVTGDVTQIDLDAPRRSGLVMIEKILKGVKPVAFVRFQDADVVRHPLVREILKAFEAWDKEMEIK